MAAENSIFEIILPVLVFLVIIGVNIGVMWYVVANRRKADAICRKLVTEQMSEIKMIAYATTAKTSRFNRRGLLVMLRDKLVFFPLGKGELLEMSFSLIQRAAWPGGIWSIVPMRKLEIYINDQKLMFMIGRSIFAAWRAGIEKMAPSLAAGNM